MHARRNDFRAAALTALALLAGCGGGAALVPFFTFGFAGDVTFAGAQHRVSLNLSPNEPTTATGSFTDAGTNISVDGAEHPLTGTWNECTLVITVQDRPGGVAPVAPLARSYSGRFTSKDVIELTPTAPAVPPALPVLQLTRAFIPAQPPHTTC